jgi:hypothetical protein
MRIAMLIAGVVFCAGAVAAPNLEAAIGSCAAQPDAKARLACYDAVAAQLKTTPAAAPGGARRQPQLPHWPLPLRIGADRSFRTGRKAASRHLDAG